MEVDPAAADIGVPSVVASRHRAGEIVVADDDVPDLDAVDAPAVRRQHQREMTVEPPRGDCDADRAGDRAVVHVEIDARGAGLSGGLLPAGLGHGKPGGAQVDYHRRRGFHHVADGIGQVDHDRAGQPLRQEIVVEPLPRRVVEGQRHPVDRARSRLGMKREIGVDRRRNAVEPRIALDVDAGADDVDGEVAVGEVAVERDLGDRSAGQRRVGAVIDIVELEVVDQRELEVKLGVRLAADTGRIEPGRMGIVQRL